LGGGTFDVSLLTVDNGVFEVVATSGDTHLGGEDFDLKFVEYLITLFKKKHPDVEEEKFRADLRSFQKLKGAAEAAKRELSSATETRIEIEGFYDGRDFSERVTRAAFEKVNMDLFLKTLEPVKRVLSDSNMEKTDIDEVILVGGSTRIPKVQELLQKFFDGKELNKGVNPDEAVAEGAAIQAAVLARTIADNDILLIDVIPLSLGIETQGGVMAVIIPRNTQIPAEKSDTFTTTVDYQDRLSIPIYEGERKMTKLNRLLGELKLTGIPPAPRGVPQIKVTFMLDQNGILRVVAEDQATGKKTEMEIQKGTLSADEVAKMTDDAEKNLKEDQEFEEQIKNRQNMIAYMDSIHSQLGDLVKNKKIEKDDEKIIKDKLKSSAAWLERNKDATKDKIAQSFHSLKKVVNPIVAKAYGGKVTDEDEVDVDSAYKLDDDDAPISMDEDDQPIKDEL
jgi:heat shock protein 5